MAWKQLEKPKTIKVNHALVREFAEMQKLPRDRPTNPARTASLKRMILAGEARPLEWASCLCKEDGIVYRVNGKHTSAILAELNGETPEELYINLQRYEADMLGDVADLNSTFDTRLSVKTQRDINHAFLGTVPGLSDIPNAIADLVVTGIAYSNCDGTNHYAGAGKSLPAERAQALGRHSGFVLWLHALVASAEDRPRHLLRGPVVGAMFRTFEKSQSASKEFWTLVRDASGPDRHSPDRKLHAMLITSSVVGATKARKNLHPREMFVKCIHAWNAFRKGESTDLKYHEGKKIPPCV